MEFNIESEFTIINTALQEGSITKAEALERQMFYVDHIILLAQRGILGSQIPEPEPVRYVISDKEMWPGRRTDGARLLYPDNKDEL